LTPVDALIILDASTIVHVNGDDRSCEWRSVASRVQLALNVTDIDAAVVFYTKLFGTGPAKRHAGYANFAITEPPLKLVLIQSAAGRGAGVAGALNHLGVEVETPEEVQGAMRRLASEGLEPDVQESTTCCYAVQDKAWVNDPDGAPWEIYTVLADAPGESDLGCSTESCAPDADGSVTIATISGSSAPTRCC
jgi:catechol 2,3-dioxygenase-like lactoylglutathione lyase family enzyme